MKVVNNGKATQVKQVFARTKVTSAIARAIDQCEQGYARQPPVAAAWRNSYPQGLVWGD